MAVSDEKSATTMMLGTSLGVSNERIVEARKEIDKMIMENDFVEPNRGDLSDASIEWRFGKPDYSIANLAYFKGKTRNHATGSLQKVVEDLVKTWEMEASHKPFEQWTVVNHGKYSTQANGGKVYVGKESAEVGNYNWLLHTCPKHLYDSNEQTFESSHHLFRGAFPDGFSWEVLDVFSPPPKVGFSWRHWADFTGTYKERQGAGELVEMYGFAVVTLDEHTKVCSIEIYYKPDEFLEVMEGIRPVESLRNGKGGFPDFYHSTSACPFAAGRAQAKDIAK